MPLMSHVITTSPQNHGHEHVRRPALTQHQRNSKKVWKPYVWIVNILRGRTTWRSNGHSNLTHASFSRRMPTERCLLWQSYVKRPEFGDCGDKFWSSAKQRRLPRCLAWPKFVHLYQNFWHIRIPNFQNFLVRFVMLSWSLVDLQHLLN